MSVVVTRAAEQAPALSDRLRAAGAEPVEAPTIVIRPAVDRRPLADALSAAREGAYDWVAFTSANGVAALDQPLGEVRVAAVGPGTADALAARGVAPDLVAERATTAGLAEALVAASAPARILLPRADLATPTLPEALRAAGWTVTEVEAYRTVRVPALPPGARQRIAAGGVDVVTFASASTVRAFVELLGGPPPPAVRVASIGPVTSQRCRQLRVRVDAEADPHDLDGLVDAVAAAVGRRRRIAR